MTGYTLPSSLLMAVRTLFRAVISASSAICLSGSEVCWSSSVLAFTDIYTLLAWYTRRDLGTNITSLVASAVIDWT